MSDIHGRKDRFDDILKQIKLTKNDTLYILGDVIDRNPDGITILKYIMHKPNIKMLLGNHEYMMLNALQNEEDISLWYRNGGLITHKRWKKQRITTREKILEFLNLLPVTATLEINGRKYCLVHGKIPKAERLTNMTYGERKYAHVWERVRPGESGPEDAILIFGHTPTIHYQDCTPMQIWYKDNLIGTDCGAAYPEGRLSCLRLDDMKEFYSN
jgi:serine/threonine protein phosphatase 1